MIRFLSGSLARASTLWRWGRIYTPTSFRRRVEELGSCSSTKKEVKKLRFFLIVSDSCPLSLPPRGSGPELVDEFFGQTVRLLQRRQISVAIVGAHGATELFVSHPRVLFTVAPHFGDPVRLYELEDAVLRSFPTDKARIGSRIEQEVSNELPQFAVPFALPTSGRSGFRFGWPTSSAGLLAVQDF